MYERGVAATSLDDVLVASGTGKSQMYHYFADKADLVIAVIEHQRDSVLNAQPELARVGSVEGITAWADAVVRQHTAKGGPFACPLGSLAAELKNDATFRPVVDAAFRRWEQPLADGLTAMQTRGDLAVNADPSRLAAMLVAALQGGMLLGRIAGDVAPLRDLLDAAVSRVAELRAK
ncbi:putative transcriptional regulator, TetR family protein [Rhodococcoides trifolii]|uniref:Transcriptional regulator, TetR family protein n=2 Tax=Rhodococcoides trifolii TaxID=908250 RepID=A0A917CVY8_9NOCA|nr:putative transcriptional regulator, TetR family protein [Rhodococcus trifolii]